VGEQFFYHPPSLVVRPFFLLSSFIPSVIWPLQQSNRSLPKHLPALISDTLRACDADLRQVLAGNVVLTGGGTLFTGFVDRLSVELTRSFPHVRFPCMPYFGLVWTSR